MEKLKPSLFSLLLIVSFLSFRDFSLTAQEKSTNHLIERFIGTWDLSTFKADPDSLLTLPGYSTPIVANFELTENGSGLIQTNRVKSNGSDFVVVMAHFYNSQKNKMYSLNQNFRGITSFPEDNLMLIEQYNFDDALIATQKITITSNDEFEIEMEIFRGDTPIKLWTHAKRRQ